MATGTFGQSTPNNIPWTVSAFGSEQMRLTSTGLGIGTSSPGEKLEVAGNGKFILPSSVGSINLRNSSTTVAELHIRPNSGKSGWLSFTEDSVADRWIVGIKNGNGGLFFNSGSPSSNTDRMVLDANGYLGIGTTNPSASAARLVVSKASGVIASFTNDVDADFQISTASTATTIGCSTSTPLIFKTGNAERARITSDGNLLVGTTSGNGTLTVSKSGNGNKGFFSNTTDADFAINCSSGVTLLSPSTATLAFGTSSTERFRIGGAGQLGVGGANYGTSGQVLTSNGSGSAPSWQNAGGGTPTLNIVSGTTQTAVASNHYVLTSASATTLTLPASPSAGAVVWVTVANGRIDNVIARNGSNINSLAENMTIDSGFAGIQLRYADATRGWVFT
jgi:hypothetical protein